MTAKALLDSNVLVAIVAEAHESHEQSLTLLTDAREHFAIAAHSFAEAFCTLTRRGDHAPFGFAPNEAWSALESVRAITVLVGLTPAQTFDAIRDYARRGGIGARLYDRLIGKTAIMHEIPVLITWNVSHMRGLFPNLTIRTPRQFAS